ncbi:hypothetical protein C477_08758 [Haloterrigena salina JCM 13891]|uniref:Helix-hairpin-helix domain-containing protein n=1 Tax=Haloterrigena salina JCM 13891 TaxID=1227488 RepID=M0CAN9_9EURY|nr:helix-hairpin-helix domain-containing protein [Haloterrigena salina]ELZ19412.1 hypothetical protein C477_08758 [Haloterrigena salina JCM 13891]
MFDAQRTAIKGSQQLFTQGLSAQSAVDRLAVTGVNGQESLQRQQLELAQAATHGYVDATTAMFPGEGSADAHRSVDEAFAQLKTTHAEFYDALERELERDADVADEFSEEFVDAFEDGTEQFLELSRSVEEQTVQSVDELSSQLSEQLERTQELQDQLEEQLERQSDDVADLLDRQAEQIEQLQQQLEEQAEEVTQQLQDQQVSAETKIETDPEHTLESVAGIDADVRERLADAGIATVDDLVRADAETVAEAADVSESDAEEWIDQAEA